VHSQVDQESLKPKAKGEHRRASQIAAEEVPLPRLGSTSGKRLTQGGGKRSKQHTTEQPRQNHKEDGCSVPNSKDNAFDSSGMGSDSEHDATDRTNASKPPASYEKLITEAIMSDDREYMTLNDIYTWLLDNYSYFSTAPSAWKVCQSLLCLFPSD
jgi:hypothetical protein